MFAALAKIPEEAFRKTLFAVSSEMAEKFECLMTFNEVLALVSSKKPPGVRIDSRLVRPGDIFVAVKGMVCDGHDFIDQALAKGAACVVCQRHYHHNHNKMILVDAPAKAAALLAQAAMGNPASKLMNLAVTGTNGKTTVAFLVQSVIQNSGQKCGLVGTINYDTGSETCQAVLTTPDCLAVAQIQEKMLRAGARFMVIEASSHALAQDRLACVDFKAAAFTNLSGDHLDYHKTQSRYFAAKRILFERLSPDAVAVLNKESPYSGELAAKTNADILWYAVDIPAPLEGSTEAAPVPLANSVLTGPADINAYIESMDITGTVFSLQYKGQRQKVHTPLLGRYNVSNHLAAAGLCLAAGFDLETIAAGLSALKTIPGRLEKLDAVGPSVLIDYAHTDDALKNVLSTLRDLCSSKLTVVFGCGGDRDRTKRPRMAKVAEELSDFVIVTSDNPRTEKPDDIISDIIAGFEKPNSQTIAIEQDREKAIDLAVATAHQDDIVLIAGKGHETYQIIGRQKIDFSDKAAALRCLRKRK